jgi:hypothetical protein
MRLAAVVDFKTLKNAKNISAFQLIKDGHFPLMEMLEKGVVKISVRTRWKKFKRLIWCHNQIFSAIFAHFLAIFAHFLAIFTHFRRQKGIFLLHQCHNSFFSCLNSSNFESKLPIPSFW